MAKPEILAEVEQIWESLTDQPAQTPQQIQAAKASIEFFHATFKCHDFDRTRQIVSPGYIQHTPGVATGPKALIESARNEAAGPNRVPVMTFKRIFVDGDFVIIHHHVHRHDGTEGTQFLHIFGYQNRLFVEHWDIQAPSSHV